MELDKLIAELVLRFDISLADPNHDWTVHEDKFIKPHEFWVRPPSTDLFRNVWFGISRFMITKIAAQKTESLLKGSNYFTIRCHFFCLDAPNLHDFITHYISASARRSTLVSLYTMELNESYPFER